MRKKPEFEGENEALIQTEERLMKQKKWIIWMSLVTMLWITACTRPKPGEILLKEFSLDSLSGVLTQSGVEIDPQIKKQGQGSLRITVMEPSIIRLFEVSDISIENAALIYQARLRTENAQGNVYLEMWCQFKGQGEFFSRGLQSPLKGTTDWTTEEIPFFLKKGEKPDLVKLNVVSEGPAMIWIDDIRLLQRALPN
jgi:hypothetical protein